MIELQHRPRRPGVVFPLEEDEQDEESHQSTASDALSEAAVEKYLEKLVQQNLSQGIVARPQPATHTHPAAVSEQVISGGDGLPAWQGFFELPG